MKILYIANSLPPAGGSEKVAWDIANELESKNEVYLIVFGKEHSRYYHNKINIITLKIQKKNWLYYLGTGRKKIISLVNEIQPDIIHAHGNTTIAIALRNYDTKKIMTFHHSEEEKYNWKFSYRLRFKLFRKMILRKYDLFTTVSNHMKKYIENKCNIRVTFIPNGVNNNIYKMRDNVIRRKNRIIYVGRLTVDKGVDVILSIAKRLPKYEFILIGKGSLYNKSSENNIKFLGSLKPIEVAEYYNSSQFALFPSRHENLPLVGLEAMASGCIVISSKHGFIEYIENTKNGYICDLNNIDDIISIIKNNRNELNNNEMKKTIEKFSLDEVSNMYFKLYNKLLEGNKE